MPWGVCEERSPGPGMPRITPRPGVLHPQKSDEVREQPLANAPSPGWQQASWVGYTSRRFPTGGSAAGCRCRTPPPGSPAVAEAVLLLPSAAAEAAVNSATPALSQ